MSAVALAVGAATAPAMSADVTSTPAEPSAATRLFRLLSLKGASPYMVSMGTGEDPRLPEVTGDRGDASSLPIR
ncbi:hypothetical protein GCM10018789_39310 [Streptomyces werraensis]|nr:hypothetical protein GCM10018789_39310 [Streptomyces werraensis]